MKICIPTETNQGKTAVVYEHFGSAPYFTIVDTETESIEIINNVDQHHTHGMCHPMKSLMGKKIDAVVTGGMGARAVQGLNQSGIKAYRTIPGIVADIINRFTKGGLEEITVENACAQHGCH